MAQLQLWVQFLCVCTKGKHVGMQERYLLKLRQDLPILFCIFLEKMLRER